MACQVTQDNKPFALKLAYVLAQLRCGITGGVKQLERDRKEKVKGLMVHFSSSVAGVFCVLLLKHRVSQWCVFTQQAEFLEELLSLSALVSCMSLAASGLFGPACAHGFCASVLQCAQCCMCIAPQNLFRASMRKIQLHLCYTQKSNAGKKNKRHLNLLAA